MFNGVLGKSPVKDKVLLSKREQFYTNTLKSLKNSINAPEDLKLVMVQHAFAPIIDLYSALDDQIAAIIPKASSSTSNPQVVERMKEKFPGRVFDSISRKELQNSDFAIQFLREVTKGHPFVIVEYGAYFAPAAHAISNDPILASKLKGFVEGTENGIKGSDDGAVGYEQVVASLDHWVISKSRSRIKGIMDMEIGPAILYATDRIFRDTFGLSLKHFQGTFGVIGAGPIGKSILRGLRGDNIKPLVYDRDLAVMAGLCQLGERTTRQEQILANSDVLFLNTGSSFLSREPDLLNRMKDNVILVLSTSGDVEGGIPQLIEKNCLIRSPIGSDGNIASYITSSGKPIRLALGSDGIGQAPNTMLPEGSVSPANLMSDMEFVGAARYLGGMSNVPAPRVIEHLPENIENTILDEWMRFFGYRESLPAGNRFTEIPSHTTLNDSVPSTAIRELLNGEPTEHVNLVL